MASQTGGRPSKLTPETQRKIVAAVKDGTPFKYAALAAGVSRKSLERWMKAGRLGKNREVVTLLSLVRKAEAESVAGLVKDIRRAKNWKANAFLLQARCNEFAPNKVELKEALKLLKSQTDELASIKARLGNFNPDPPKGEATRAGDAVDQRADGQPPPP